MNLFLLDIIEDTVVDGPGFRTSLYAAGCRHHCPGCHNPQSWEREHGHAVGVEEVAERLLTDPFSNITFSGGDPLEQVEAFTELAKLIKNKSKKKRQIILMRKKVDGSNLLLIYCFNSKYICFMVNIFVLSYKGKTILRVN